MLSAPLRHLHVETNGIHKRNQADWQTERNLKPWAPFGVTELLIRLVLSLSTRISNV